MLRSQLFNFLGTIIIITACSGERPSSEDYSQEQRSSPLTPEEQMETFQLPEGFEIELVASDPNLANVITVSFDDKGRMWAVTAQEYPLDGNEQPESARLLYELGGRDRVLVFDTPTESGRQLPRTFVDSLAMPMAVLPVGDDILIAQGPDILRYRDTSGDGKADEKEVLLTGFGIQDSHLMPHGFTRGPGDWIYFAQGAFNYSNVETREGTVVQFDYAKIGRFQPDGTNFEVVGAGLNNIWGFVIDRKGEMFIQEANDLGYPVVPFFIGANYPGIGFDKLKPYAPWQPPAFDDFTMGGTGLSGLALAEDIDGFPEPYQGVMYLANPITRKINIARIHDEGTGYKMEHLQDFLESTDEWFRPIAIHFGPDDCLYIVDWYNKIIAHNEVPRDHPERDQEHGRIWRVCPTDKKTRDIPDLTQVEERDLLTHLGAQNTWEGRAAWFQIVERSAVLLVPELRELALATENALDVRLRALWSLEGLYEIDYEVLEHISQDEHRAMRREAVRLISVLDFEREKVHQLVENLTDDPDPQVRAEVIRTLDSIDQPDIHTIELLIQFGKEPLHGERIVSIQGNRIMKVGEASDRDFERYLARAALEKHPRLLEAFLESKKGQDIPAENRMLAILSLDSASQRMLLAPAVASLNRPLIDEELVVLSKYLNYEPVHREVERQFMKVESQHAVLDELLLVPERVDGTYLPSLIAPSIKGLISRDNNKGNRSLMIQLASTYNVHQLEPELLELIDIQNKEIDEKIAALRALRAIGSKEITSFTNLLANQSEEQQIRLEALRALIEAGDEQAFQSLLEYWPILNNQLRNVALEQLSSSKQGGRILLQGVEYDIISREDLDGRVIDRLFTFFQDDPSWNETLEYLSLNMHKGLLLTGHPADYVDTKLELNGPFTVETWVKVNTWAERDVDFYDNPGILGNPAGAAFDFEEGFLRIVTDGGHRERIRASKPVALDLWTHLATTRNENGAIRIYMNGDLDRDENDPIIETFSDLDIGKVAQNRSLSGMLTEFRVWDYARSEEEIRDNFDRSFQGETTLPDGLTHYFSGEDTWISLKGNASVVSTMDYPPILTAAEAQELEEKFDQYREYALMEGDLLAGKSIFTSSCMACHSVGTEGGTIAPPLDGVGYTNVNGLLRSLLTPNAAIESGYRQFRVETVNNQIYVGFLVSRDEDTIVLRRPEMEDLRIRQTEIVRAEFTSTSMMPEGLLEALSPEEVTDLFTYMRALR